MLVSAACGGPHGSGGPTRGAALSAEARATLDRVIDDARLRLEVPGAAVAITLGGDVIYERAVGVRALADGETVADAAGEPVTADTRFLLGSVTKPMTTFLIATLVDERVLTWDARVVDLLPGFAVDDATGGATLTLADLACHCSGLPGRDLEPIFEAGLAPEARIATLAAVAPTAARGTTYQYSNLAFAAAGFAAARATAPGGGLGPAYDEAMAARVFAPLGMDATFDRAEVAAGDHAAPHALALGGAVRAMAIDVEAAVDGIRPAGGAWASVRDLAAFAATEARGGLAPDGRRVVSRAALAERWRLRIEDGDGPGSGYGLGLGVGRRGDEPMLTHDGGAFGFGTSLVVIPGRELGVAVVTNVRNGGGHQQLPWNAVVVDAILAVLDGEAPATDEVERLVAARRAADAEAMAGVEPAPTRWWATVAGRYRAPALGVVELTADGWFDVGEWRSRFGRRTDDAGGVALVLLDPPFAGTPLAWHVDEDGAAVIDVPDAVRPYQLRREPR